MRLSKITSVLTIAAIISAGCVDHRETRTEILDENTYLDKQFLTRANPGGPEGDDGWLMGVSVTAVSVPAPIPDIFPALQADTKYVRFSFAHDRLQVVDAMVPGPWSVGEEEGPLGNPLEAADLAPRIIQEYEGNHVDIQLRKNLDGEVTNFVEEYRERDWVDRQFFKTELENGAFSDLSKVSWYYDYSVSEVMELVSASMVPGSLRYVDTVAEESNFPGTVDWEKGDYIEWKIRLNFQVLPFYSSLMNYRQDIDTQTVDVKYSFWRRPQDPEGQEYIPREIDEHDIYKRKFGIWDYVVRNYQDPQTGLVGAKSYLTRFNPHRPIDFYMVDVPKEYREKHPEYGVSLYESVGNFANKVFEEAGVDARISFKPADDGGYVREFGDIRYSFVVWHNNSFTDIPWLGYGPSWVDPRTGEIYNATLNFNYYMGLRWYTEVVKEYLNEITDGEAFANAGESCTTGETRKIIDEDAKNRIYSTTLFNKLKEYMGEEDPQKWIPEHTDTWEDYYHMMLSDLRFFYPPYQTFVYSPRGADVGGMHERRTALMEREYKFWEIAADMEKPGGPMGIHDFTSGGSIEKGVEFINKTKEAMLAHQEMKHDRLVAAGLRGIDLVEMGDLYGNITNITQRCVAGKWQSFDEWDADIRWRIAHQTSIHELGHDIGQYHNFYGNVDKKHRQPCTVVEGEKDFLKQRPGLCIGSLPGSSNSVMDYIHHFAEVSADLGYFPYDRAALIYAYRYDSQDEVGQETDKDIVALLHPEWADGTPDGRKDMSKAMLYGNDYHAPLSPLIETFDLGTTPSEIVFNAIQYYDFMYRFRNYRSFRQYWETWTYPNSVFSTTFPMRRFLELWALDFDAGSIENDLRILGVDASNFEFDNIIDEFNQEMGQANRLLTNFYRAILNQSAAERNYQTTYNTFYGDITHMGIIYDKYYAMFSFLGLWPADMYNWDNYALLAFSEATFGNAQYYSDAIETLKVMLGGSYDVYPWFLPTAALVFAQDTHHISFGDRSMKEWIGARVFERSADMVDYFGFDPRDAVEDPSHLAFSDAEGQMWTYIHLDDRNHWVVASEDINPILFKMIWDYNESVYVNRSTWVTTYDIKYFVDFYEYFAYNASFD